MMRLEALLTDGAVLAELGRRVERHRLQRNWTQAELAYEAQIGRATLQRLERGQSVQSLSLIKVLRTLELLGALDAALPESIELPIAQLEREQRASRKRARRAHGSRGRRGEGRSKVETGAPISDDGASAESESEWRWGEAGDGG
jgi:transcriptional regulator with XRE-family HTH domain